MAHAGIPAPPADITAGTAIWQASAKVFGSLTALTVILPATVSDVAAGVRVVEVQSDDAKPIKLVTGSSVPINTINAQVSDSAGHVFALSSTAGFASAAVVAPSAVGGQTVTVTFTPAATNPQVTVTGYQP